MVVPAGFEPAAFHLGGERSILLSYGTGKLRIVLYQRFNIVTGKFGPAVQETELDRKV